MLYTPAQNKSDRESCAYRVWMRANNNYLREVHVKSVGTFVMMVLLSSVLLSQGSSGRILGSVTDQSGAVIPGVTVTIRDVDRGTSRTLTTDEAGVYNAPNLLPGNYMIR